MSTAHQAGPFENGAARLPIDQQRSVVRVFVSSPNDVDLERKVTERVINRLQAKFAVRGEIQAYFWEFEPMSNYETFQAQIPDSNQFDIVICILWSRLGTPLVAPDGKRYRSGTEYEVISSRAAWRANGRPNLMIYLNTAPAQIRQFPDAEFERSIGELRALKDFIAEYCRDPVTGENKGAYNAYSELGQFEQLVERHLEKLFDEKLPVQRTGGGAKADQHLVWGRRSPFRGLEAFDFEHSPVFFGRTKAIGEVVTRLRKRMSEVEDARAARLPGAEIEPAAFLLVSAMSGVGKSSLIRAGVLPLMVEPGKGATLWRRALMRPSEATGDLFDGLARALCRPEALPELVSGDVIVDSIADLLRRNPAGIEFGLVTALDRAVAGSKRNDLSDSQGTAGTGPDQTSEATPAVSRLVLFIDQLEELFTLERISDQERTGFITALAAVARSGKAYVIGTLRSDFFGRCSELPLLAELSQGDGLYHLLPPSNAELSQIIKQPAAAAGLEFQSHPETKESLDDRLRDAAIRSPEALPLLQFCLEELYRAQEGRGDGLLTHHDYEAMGGVEGSLARRAEDVFLSLDAEGQAQFDHVMRRITAVVIEEAGAFNRRWADYDELTKPPGAKAFVDAFLDPAARLFVIDRTDAGQVVVSVTHEALLTHWERLYRWLVENRESLLTRAQVSADARRWLDSGKNGDYLYRAGLPLVKAQKTLAEGFLDSTERDFVEASTLRAHAEFIRNRRVTQVVIGAISAALVLALALAGLAFRQSRQAGKAKARADQEAKRANLARAEAEKLVNFMTTDLRDKLKPIGRLDLLADVNKRVSAYYDAFPETIERPETRRQRALALANQGDIQKDQGDLTAALKSFEQSFAIVERLTQQNPKNLDWQRDLTDDLEKIGDVLKTQGDVAGALEKYRSASAIEEKLARQYPADLQIQRQLSFGWERIGQLLEIQGDLPHALENEEKVLTIRRELVKQDASNVAWEYELSLALSSLGQVLTRQGSLSGAIERYEECLTIRQSLAAGDPSNAEWQHELAVSLENVGDGFSAQNDLAKSLDSYRKALTIRRTLTMKDPTNSNWQRELAQSYDDVAGVLTAQGELASGFENYQQSLEVRQKLAARDPSNAIWQRDLSVSFSNAGQVLIAEGKMDEGLENYRDCLSVSESLVKRDPANAEWRRDLVIILVRIGDALKTQNNFDDALKSYQRAAAIGKGLVAGDSSNAQWQNDLSWIYACIGDVFSNQRKRDEAMEAYQTSLAITEKLIDQAPGNPEHQADLSVICRKIGDILKEQGLASEALVNYQRALAASEKLIAQDSSNVERAVQLALCYYSVAIVLPRTDDAAVALVHSLLVKSDEIMLRLRRAGALRPGDEAYLKDIETALAGP